MSAGRLNEMETFVRVVEAQSFTGAARRLGLTPSAVSRHVRALEQRLGVRLVNRTTRSLALTEEGRLFFAESQGVLAAVEAAERSVRSASDALAGTLRVSVPADFARLHLARMLAAFAARHPALSLEVDATDRFVDLVGEGVDVAVRIAALPDSSLVARRLAPSRRVLCAAPAYLRRRGTPRAPAELAAHECIAYEHLGTGGGWPFKTPRGRRWVRPAGRLRTNSGEIMRRLALAGHGIVLLPTFLVGDDLRAKRLRPLLTDVLDADTALYALHPHRTLVPAKVRAFVDDLARHCGERPYWDRGL